jgi:hypothetical protein
MLREWALRRGSERFERAALYADKYSQHYLSLIGSGRMRIEASTGHVENRAGEPRRLVATNCTATNCL